MTAWLPEAGNTFISVKVVNGKIKRGLFEGNDGRCIFSNRNNRRKRYMYNSSQKYSNICRNFFFKYIGYVYRMKCFGISFAS